MIVEKIVVGSLETNCYILIKDGNCLIIDPGAEYEKIKEVVKKYNLVGIIITHYHFDHIGALEQFKNNDKVNVYDINNLKEGKNNIENFIFEVIFTPGHKSDCITVYFKETNQMFVGDFIFKNTVGRTDLETGNYIEIINSIKKIIDYPHNTIIYPGHGPSTTLKEEIENNMYFNNN